MQWSTGQFAIASAIGITLVIALLLASQRVGRRMQMRRYCQGLNDALCEAIGDYRATVRMIVAHMISGQRALESLEDRPVVDPPNVGEFNPLITVVWPKNGTLEDIDVVIEGPKALICYISKTYVQTTELAIGENTVRQINDHTWEVRLMISVFNNLDARVIENLRSLLYAD